MKKVMFGLLSVLGLSLALAQTSVTQGEGPALNIQSLNPIYQETFEGEPQGMMQSSILLGQDGSWTAGLNKGSYSFENQTDASSVYYIYLGGLGGNAASVDVTVQASQFSGAGLLYRFDASKGHYFALIITGPNNYAFYKRANDGLSLLMEGTSGAILPGTNRLSIVDEAGEMKLYANETFLATVSDNEVLGDRAGVLVAGTGRFQFDNLTVYNYAQTQSPMPIQENPLAPKSNKPSTESGDKQEVSGWNTQAPQQAMVLSYELVRTANKESTTLKLEFTVTPQVGGLWEVKKTYENGESTTFYTNAEGQLFENGQATDKSMFKEVASLWNFGKAFFKPDFFSLEESEDAWFYSYNTEDIQIRTLFDKATGILLEDQYCNTSFCETTRLLAAKPLGNPLASTF